MINVLREMESRGVMVTASGHPKGNAPIKPVSNNICERMLYSRVSNKSTAGNKSTATPNLDCGTILAP